MDRPVRVVLVDDHALVRSPLRRYLEARGIAVVGEAANGEDALSAMTQLDPDVALVDIFMAPMDGLEVTRLALGRGLRASVILTTGGAAPDLEARARAAGATAFIHKSAPTSELVAAIRAVALPGRGARADVEPPHGVSRLSTRELQVLALFADGYGRSQIAARLGISPRTVDMHRSSVLRKLGVTSLVEAARIADHAGIVWRPE